MVDVIRPKLMPRFSLKTLVFVLPLFVGISLAWVLASAKIERDRAIKRFDHSVRENAIVNIGLLHNSIGGSATRKKLAEASQRNLNIFYGGGVRVAQIIPNDENFAHGVRYNLTGIGGLNGANGWTAPVGTCFSDVQFDGEALLLTLHGTFQFGSKQVIIPAQAPETYSINWPSDDPNPPKHHLQEMIRTRHSKDLPGAGG